MKHRVQVGLIGCGNIANRHVNWFLEHPDCDITALCDVSDDAIRTRETQACEIRPDAGIQTTTDYRDLLNSSDLDAVAVLLPHHLHYHTTKEALEAGKHVLVEKPMVTDADHARDLVRTAQMNDKLICIGYQRSFLSEFIYIRNMIQAGELGEIQFVSSHLEQSWYHNITKSKGGTSWRSDPDSVGGGQLVDSGSHTVAALLDVTQLVPQEVFAFVENKDLAVDVNTSASLRFTNGAIGTLCVGGFGHSVTEVLRVVGDKKSARVLFRTVREQALEIDGEVIDAKSQVEPSTPNRNFIDAIMGKAKIVTDATLGLRVALLTDAIYASAAQKGPVSVSAE